MIEYCEKTFNGASPALLDFGKDAFAYLELAWNGTESLEVSLGECLADGKTDPSPGGFRYFRKIKIKQQKPGEWLRLEIPAHRSPYKDGYPSLPFPAEAGGEIAPFRYVEIAGTAGKVRVRRAAVYPEWNEEASCFESDNQALNRVWNFCKYSIKATAAFGKFIDGERERVPYEGDAFINQLGYFCCDANYSIAENTLNYLQKVPTWPTEWTLLVPLLVRDYLLYSGDSASIKRWMPWLEKSLLSDAEDQWGFIGKKEKGDIVDWPPCERDGYELSDRNLVPNCYRYGALLAMYQLTEKERYLQKAAVLKKNLRQKFLRRNFWRDNLESEHCSLHGALFAQYFGLTEPEEYSVINAYLRSRGMACSVYGAHFLLEALGMLRDPDTMLDLMTADHSRSWLGMMEQGATISMEAWNNAVKPNQDWNHAWGASPANIIPRWIAGIRPGKAGFEEFVFDPQPGYLEKFFCRHPSRFGAVDVEFEKGRGTITVPAGTTALYCGKLLKAGKHDF